MISTNKVKAFYAYRNKLITTLVLVIFSLIITNSVFSQNITGHQVITETNQLKLDHIARQGKYDLVKFPMEKYEIDESLIHKLKIGDTLPEQLLDLPLRVMNRDEIVEGFRLRDIKDDRVIVLDFWATYCAPCIRSMGRWDTMADTLKEDIFFMGVFNSYQHYLEPFLQDKGWMSFSAFGLHAHVLSRYFFDRPVVGRLVWIRGGRLAAITVSEGFDLATILRTLRSDLLDLESTYEWTYMDNCTVTQ